MVFAIRSVILGIIETRHPRNEARDSASRAHVSQREVLFDDCQPYTSDVGLNFSSADLALHQLPQAATELVDDPWLRRQ